MCVKLSKQFCIPFKCATIQCAILQHSAWSCRCEPGLLISSGSLHDHTAELLWVVHDLSQNWWELLLYSCDNGDGPVLHMGIPLASHSLCCKAIFQQSCFVFVFSCLWERVTISLSPWSGLSCTPWSAKQVLSELVQRVNKSRAFLITEVLFFHSLLAYMQQQGKLFLLLHMYSWKS